MSSSGGAATDVLVVGGGIAGVSIGYELARDRSVRLLEAEPVLAHHTTGRSAATFLETLGDRRWRALTRASRAFLESPPEHFEVPLMWPRPLLQLARPGRLAALEDRFAEVCESAPDVQLLTARQAVEVCPVVREDQICGALLETHAQELDVPAVHGGYLRGLRARGGDVVTSAAIVAARREGGAWRVTTADGREFTAGVLVDAAGAWLDEVAVLAGARPAGVVPRRRTIFVTGSPLPSLTRDLPVFGDLDGGFYIRPLENGLLCSPGDETPWPPEDVGPDGAAIDAALAEIAHRTTFTGLRVRSSRAGLRTSVADGLPVVGWDPDAEGLFWFGGQGGFGIQAGPALARTGANLLRGLEPPKDVAALGLDVADLAPGRPGLAATTVKRGPDR